MPNKIQINVAALVRSFGSRHSGHSGERPRACSIDIRVIGSLG